MGFLAAALRTRVTVRVILVVAALIFAELTLQALERVSLVARRVLAPPWAVDEAIVPDKRLVFVGNPLNPEHDERGYRNHRGITHADIIVLGDSQAYGPANPDDAWPAVTARRLGRDVYNMALPAYGPVQSLLQLDEALALRPRLVIVAPYLGNDFYDSFVMAVRHPELTKSVAPALRAAAERLETEHPLGPEVSRIFSLGQTSPADQRQRSPFIRMLSQHVKLYGVARAVLWRLSQPPRSPLLSRDFSRTAASLTPTQREFASPFTDGTWRTVLTARYRGIAVNDGDPRIRVGFEVARDAILTIAARCRLTNVRTLVILTPTKELVFWPRVHTPGAHPGLEREAADELRLSDELKGVLREHGIDFLDLLEPLRKAQQQPFYEDIDGHLNVAGHALVGQLVAERADGKAASSPPPSTWAKTEYR